MTFNSSDQNMAFAATDEPSADASVSVEEPPLPFKARVKRMILNSSAVLAPSFTANKLAHRYLQSDHGYMVDLAHGRQRFDVSTIGQDMAVLHSSGATAAEDAPRILVVPGHDGHYRQFVRLMRTLEKKGAWVDMVALPGHLYPEKTICSMRDMTEAVKRAVQENGPYDAIVAHCVTANATLFALRDGLECPKIVLISTPLDLPGLVRFGGQQYGLSGRCLDRFVDRVSELGAPYALDTPWKPIAKERSEDLLVVHARADYAAPVEHIYEIDGLWQGAEIAVFDHGGHNTILNVKSAVNRIADFLIPANPPSQ